MCVRFIQRSQNNNTLPRGADQDELVNSQSKMREIPKLSLLFIISMIFCGNKGIRESRSFNDFHYPFDSLVNAKVFVYEKNDDNHSPVSRYEQVIEKDQQHYYIEALLGDMDIRDSSVYEIVQERTILKEMFIIKRDVKTHACKTIKGFIFGKVENDKMLSSTVRFNEADNIITFESLSKYDSAYATKIFDNETNCFSSKDTLSLYIQHLDHESMNEIISMTGKSVYAYGIGLVYYSRFFHNDKSNYEFRLKKIIPYQEYLKQ
jgi:hypothetical protein